ncbi:MAG: hypothetical protein ABSG44_02795, partial [Thermodesulfobacteriota bacterium]
SATLNITHGKPPFGEFLRGTKNYIRKIETCLSFSIIRSELGSASGLFLSSAPEGLPATAPFLLDIQFPFSYI